MLFFSTVPITLAFAVLDYFLFTINAYQNSTAVVVRTSLNISPDNINNLLWVIFSTILYFLIIFFIFKTLTRPIKKIEKAIMNLADGEIKEEINIGGNRQFSNIEHNLNKLNNELRQKEKFIKKSTEEYEKFIPKQFIKFFGKKSLLDLQIGETVSKELTTMYCEIKSVALSSSSMSLEENFNHVNSYLNIVSPIIRKYNGYIDKYLGNGLIAVFPSAKNAFNCAHVITKAIDDKNKENINLPALSVGISLDTQDVAIGIIGDEERKSLSIISDSQNLTEKMNEINRQFSSLIIFSKSTLNEISAFNINYRYIGNLTSDNGDQVGIFESLEIYEKPKRDKLTKNKINFEQAVRAYFNGKYDQAKSLFEKVYRQEKNDKVCYTYYNKCCDKL